MAFIKQEEFEDTKGAIIILNRRRTDNTIAKKKIDKRKNNDLHNITHKTKDRVTQTPTKNREWTRVH